MPSVNIVWLNEVDNDDVYLIGEHGAKLGELTKLKIPIPEGFAVTSHAFNKFLTENNLNLKAKHLISTVNFNDPYSLQQVSNLIKNYFLEASFPTDLKLELYDAYKKLSGFLSETGLKITHSPFNKNHLDVNKNQDIFGEAGLLNAIKDSWAHNFTELNIAHNHHNLDFSNALVVQRDLSPDKSGKIYTVDTFSKDKNKIIIKASHGLFNDNLNLVTMPDHYEIKKDDHSILFVDSFPQVKISRKVNSVKKLVDLPTHLKNKQKLLQNEIEELVKNAKLLEKFNYFPQEIDFGIEKNKIYFTNFKPITTLN